MRLRPALFSATLAVALAAGTAPALAADGTRDLSIHANPVLPPYCPPGEKAVWVDDPGTPPRLVIDQFGRITFIPGTPAFHGWQCQPIRLVPVGG